MIESTGIYIRVSTEEQAKDGFSIAAQKEKLTKYAEVSDWIIFDYYIDDGISGKNIKDRPEMQRMLSDIQSGKVNNILVYKLDRLTRSLMNLMELIQFFEQYNCSLNSQTERLDTSNAVGRMFVKIIGTFAEFERENLAERVSFGYEEKTRQGNYTNTNGVFGYDYVVGEQSLLINEEEAEQVRRIYELYLKGNSFYKIANTFNFEGIESKRGGKWAAATIKSILTNPLYIGRVRYGVSKKLQARSFEQQGNNIPVIIEEELWDKVQQVIRLRTRHKIRRYPSQNSYFFGVARCQLCGSKMLARQQMQHGSTYITYSCSNKALHLCNSKGFSHNKLEIAFCQYISCFTFLLSKEAFMEIESESFGSKKLTDNNNKLKALITRKKKIRDNFIQDKLSLEEYRLLIAQVERREETIQERIKTISSSINSHKNISFPNVRDIICDFKLNWSYLTNEERVQFFEQFVDSIIVYKETSRVVIEKIQFKILTV